MLKGYKILTITHRHVNLKDLAHFVLQNEDALLQQQQLIDLKSHFVLDELLYLSTCNRVIFLFYSSSPLTENFKKQFLQKVNPKLSEAQIDQVRAYEGQNAIEHLYEVSASIDSMVVGEREILRQIRDSYKDCNKLGLTGDKIRLAIKFMVQFAKQVYAQTRIGEKPVSVVSLAIKKLLESKVSNESRILLVGAGQTNTLVSKFLKKHSFENVHVFNRTLSKAAQLAKILGGKAFTLDQLSSFQENFDCIIVCTGATEAIITTQLYKNLLNGDGSEKVVIDLSMPNNVSSKVVDEFNINYIEIEGLRALAKENLNFREKEVHSVRLILDQSVNDFQHVYQMRMIEMAMHGVPSEIKAIKNHAMNSVFRKELDGLDDKSRALLEKMMDYMEKRCIGIPMQAAKKTLSNQ